MPETPLPVISYTPPSPVTPAAVMSHTPGVAGTPAAVVTHNAPSPSSPAVVVSQTPPTPATPAAAVSHTPGAADSPEPVVGVTPPPPPPPPGVPVNTVAPELTETVDEGVEILSVDDGTWTGTTPITYTYQWRVNETDIPGATGASHGGWQLATWAGGITLGDIIDCVVTATNALGEESAISNTYLVESAFTSPP